MARGGMLPAVFARLHPRYGSPMAVVVVLTGITAIAPVLRSARAGMAGRRGFVWRPSWPTCSWPRRFSSSVGGTRIFRVRTGWPAPALVGWLAVAATVFFILLYLPGSPAALVWPEEWAIVLLWMVLGAALAAGIRARMAMLGPARQAQLILGDQLQLLARRRW